MFSNDLFSPRAVVRPGLWAVIQEDGLINNVVPGIEKCRVSIVASPKMGAGFVEYIVTTEEGGYTSRPFAGEEGIESFLYVLKGKLKVTVEGTAKLLSETDYVFAPAGKGILFSAEEEPCKFLLYKQRFVPFEDKKPWTVWGTGKDLIYRELAGLSNVHMTDLLPTDIAFDMNFHILEFEPGARHPFVETHVQEHGAYITSGQGMYYMDDRWMGIKEGDFMWFGPYVPQGAYGVGTEKFSYVYSKDCNRDVTL